MYSLSDATVMVKINGINWTIARVTARKDRRFAFNWRRENRHEFITHASAIDSSYDRQYTVIIRERSML